jgi:hypothetical protein
LLVTTSNNWQQEQPSTSTITIAIPMAMAAENTVASMAAEIIDQQSKKVKFDNDDSTGVDPEQGRGVVMMFADATQTTTIVADGSQESTLTSTTPLTSSTQKNPTIDRTLVFTVLIALVGVGVSAAFVGLGIQGADNDKQLQFEKQANERIKAVEIAWQNFEVAGLWIHEACRASADQNDKHLTRGICSRDDFLELYEYLLSSGLDFQAVSWVPNVTHVDRASMEDESRTCKY